MAEGEEEPENGGAGRPRIERGEKRKIAAIKIDERNEHGEHEAQRRKRGHSEQQDGIREKAVQIGEDEQEARENKGGGDREDACVPELLRAGRSSEAGERSGSEAEPEGEHNPDGRKDSEGGESDGAEVEKAGVHGFGELLVEGSARCSCGSKRRTDKKGTADAKALCVDGKGCRPRSN